MRNVMLATIVVVLSGALVGGAALLPDIVDKIVDGPAEPQDFVLPSAKDAAAGQKSSGSGSFQPGGRAPAAGTVPAAPVWADRLFTASLSKDFGAVPHGTPLVHHFPLTNAFAVPVEITGITTSCGCVTATRGKRILQPGESTTIDVAFDTREFTGPNSQTVRVGFGPYARCHCVLTVSAVSQSDVVFTPDRVSFGDVTEGRTAVQSTEVEYSGPLDWKIKEVVVPKDLPFTATLSEVTRQPGKVAYRLSVTLKTDAPSGRIRGFIYLKTDQADAPAMPLMVTANVQGPRGVAQANR